MTGGRIHRPGVVLPGSGRAHDTSVSPSTWDPERGTALFVIALSGLAALGFTALAAHLLRAAARPPEAAAHCHPVPLIAPAVGPREPVSQPQGW